MSRESTIVYTGGTFDLLHAGHIDLLRVCKRIAGENGKVVVALNRDDFVSSFKDGPPLCSYEEREDALKGCRYVDEVVPNAGGQDSRLTIEVVKPHFIIVGDDWSKRDYYAQMGFSKEWLTERGIVLLYIARQRPLSSSGIKNRMISHG